MNNVPWSIEMIEVACNYKSRMYNISHIQFYVKLILAASMKPELRKTTPLTAKGSEQSLDAHGFKLVYQVSVTAITDDCRSVYMFRVCICVCRGYHNLFRLDSYLRGCRGR